MRRIALCSLLLTLVLVACSPSAPGDDQASDAPAIAPVTSTGSAPADPTLGSQAWYAWVDQSLDIAHGANAPKAGTDAWNRAVQRALGPAAPREKIGSPQWQGAVDAMLRTRNSEARKTHSGL